MKRERKALLKDRARHFAAGAIEALEPMDSGRFDDLDPTAEEWLLVEEELQAIAWRIFPTTSSRDADNV